jgi:predicted nucleotidyltransferase
MKELKDAIIPILLSYGVKRAAFFGSYARGDYDEKSDIDLLFEPPAGMGLSVVDLKRDLEEKLKKKVDLVSFNGINKYLRESILSHQIKLI